MEQSATFAETVSLLGDPSRAAMLLTLLDGRAYTANELARAASVTPQTASFHLDKMLKASFLEALRQGRHRYFRLAGSDVAHALESLLTLQHAPLPRRIATSCPAHMREARACFDHVAGRLGVRVYRGITARGWTLQAGAHLGITAAAAEFLEELAITPEAFPVSSKPCMDWSEREHHFAGDLGSLLMQAMIAKRWILRGKTRALTPTEEGLRRLAAWKM